MTSSLCVRFIEGFNLLVQKLCDTQLSLFLNAAPGSRSAGGRNKQNDLAIQATRLCYPPNSSNAAVRFHDAAEPDTITFQFSTRPDTTPLHHNSSNRIIPVMFSHQNLAGISYFCQPTYMISPSLLDVYVIHGLSYHENSDFIPFSRLFYEKIIFLSTFFSKYS